MDVNVIVLDSLTSLESPRLGWRDFLFYFVPSPVFMFESVISSKVHVNGFLFLSPHKIKLDNRVEADQDNFTG